MTILILTLSLLAAFIFCALSGGNKDKEVWISRKELKQYGMC